MRILDGIKDWLNQKSSVQMVADDPQMASEILLLLRTMFADGTMVSQELNMFKMFCSSIFHIPEEDVPDVINYLKETGYETSGEQAASMLAELPAKRKQELIVHLLSMARADDFLDAREVEIISRVAKVLGYTPEQIRSFVV